MKNLLNCFVNKNHRLAKNARRELAVPNPQAKQAPKPELQQLRAWFQQHQPASTRRKAYLRLVFHAGPESIENVPGEQAMSRKLPLTNTETSDSALLGPAEVCLQDFRAGFVD